MESVSIKIENAIFKKFEIYLVIGLQSYVQST